MLNTHLFLLSRVQLSGLTSLKLLIADDNLYLSSSCCEQGILIRMCGISSALIESGRKPLLPPLVNLSFSWFFNHGNCFHVNTQNRTLVFLKIGVERVNTHISLPQSKCFVSSLPNVSNALPPKLYHSMKPFLEISEYMKAHLKLHYF